MELFYCVLYYALFLFIGDWIKYLGIPSIYNLPYFVLIPFNFLSISYSIKKSYKKMENKKYKQLIIPLIFLYSVLDTIVILLFEAMLTPWIIIISTTVITLLVIKPAKETIEQKTKKNIEQYFKKREKDN